MSALRRAVGSEQLSFGERAAVDRVESEPVDELHHSAHSDLAAANRVHYGLTSTILAGDTYKAFELAPKVWHGVVNINSPTLNEDIQAAIGGVRDSGWGRTGPNSLADFTDVIWINATSGERELPF
jgi:Aldehyde dehydrogenase family